MKNCKVVVMALLLLLVASVGVAAGGKHAATVVVEDASLEQLTVSGFSCATAVYPADEDCDLSFGMTKAVCGNVSLGVEDTLTDTVDIEAALSRLCDDIAKTEKTIGSINTVEVYLMSRPERGQSYASGGKLFVTPEDFFAGNYYPQLMSALYHTDEVWVGIGLAGVLNASDCDTAALTDYYSTDADMDMLGLFPAWFLPQWADDEQIALAEDTAVSLTSYVLREYGLSILLAGIDNTVRTEWLDSIGVMRECTYAYDTLLRNVGYSVSQWAPLVVTTEHFVYYLEPLADMTTPNEIEALLDSGEASIDCYYEYLHDNAPDYYESCVLKKEIWVYFNADAQANSAMYRVVRLASASALSHEIAHCVMARVNTDAGLFWSEGMAEYLSKCVYSEPYFVAQFEETMQQAENSTHVPSDMDDSWGQFLSYFIQKCTAENGEMVSPQELETYLTAMYTAHLQVPEYASPIVKTYLDDTIQGVYDDLYGTGHQQEQGDELSYWEAGLFVNYLADHYSFSAVMDAYAGRSLQECFGEDYATLLEAFRATVTH